jgi:hypothetical protein
MRAVIVGVGLADLAAAQGPPFHWLGREGRDFRVVSSAGRHAAQGLGLVMTVGKPDLADVRSRSEFRSVGRSWSGI